MLERLKMQLLIFKLMGEQINVYDLQHSNLFQKSILDAIQLVLIMYKGQVNYKR